MIPLSQTLARKLVESIWLEFERIDQMALSRSLERRDDDGRKSVVLTLSPLLQLVVENLEELGFLQRTLLNQDEWEEHQPVIERSSLDDDQRARELMPPWVVLRQQRSQPLVGYLLLLIGDGWTGDTEIHALTEDFHGVLTTVHSRLEKLPVDVGPIRTIDGSQIFMSVALGDIWDDVQGMGSMSRRLLRAMQKHGPCSYERLSSCWGKSATKKQRKSSVNAVRNALKIPLARGLIRYVGKEGKLFLWQLTGLGSECLAFIRK